VLVEAALILPVLMVMVFGIIEMGLLFDTATVTSNSSRAGARLASANYGEPANDAGRSAVLENVRLTVEEALNGLRGNVTPVELWVYEANNQGRPTTSGTFTSCTGPCIRYTWNAGTGHFASPTGTWSDPQDCGVTLDRVGVYVRVSHRYLSAAFFSGTKTVDEHSVMRIEPETGTC
jgi:hypothetical protein